MPNPFGEGSEVYQKRPTPFRQMPWKPYARERGPYGGLEEPKAPEKLGSEGGTPGGPGLILNVQTGRKYAAHPGANLLNSGSPPPIGRRFEADVCTRNYTRILLLPPQLSHADRRPFPRPIISVKGRENTLGDRGFQDMLEG